MEELYLLQIKVKKNAYMPSLVKAKVAHVDSLVMEFKSLLLSFDDDWKRQSEWVKAYFSENQCHENTKLTRSATKGINKKTAIE
uniref:Uncharacterized protein n=1 Tax=Noccaea caerulescens TaxID=107243 RepID=A0A1J3IVW0_NOCCA